MANEILTSWQHSDQGETEQYELSQFKLRHVEMGKQTGWQGDISKNHRRGVNGTLKLTNGLSYYPKEDYFF